MRDVRWRRFGALLCGCTAALVLACGEEAPGDAYNCAYFCPAQEGSSSTYNTNATSADLAESMCVQAKGSGCPDPLCNCTKN